VRCAALFAWDPCYKFGYLYQALTPAVRRRATDRMTGPVCWEGGHPSYSARSSVQFLIRRLQQCCKSVYFLLYVRPSLRLCPLGSHLTDFRENWYWGTFNKICYEKSKIGPKYSEPYTECPGRNVKNFGRVFLTLKYTDITQNTYIQSWTVTEIMTREKCGLLWGRRTVAAS
jgi:hypothetical protein